DGGPVHAGAVEAVVRGDRGGRYAGGDVRAVAGVVAGGAPGDGEADPDRGGVPGAGGTGGGGARVAAAGRAIGRREWLDVADAAGRGAGRECVGGVPLGGAVAVPAGDVRLRAGDGGD